VITKILILLVLLCTSFAFSAAEVALYSARSSGVRPRGKLYSRMLESPQLLLSTILISNAMSVFALTLIGASLAVDTAVALRINRTFSLAIEVVVVSGVLIIAADAVPKILAARRPDAVLTFMLPLVVVLLVLESPLVFPLKGILTRLTARKRGATIKIDDKGLKSLAQVAGSAGVIDLEEAEVLRKISYLGDKNVRGTMTPRTEIRSIAADISFNEAVDAFRKTEHSRMPVYSELPENVVGMLYARDVLPYLKNKSAQRRFDVRTIMRIPVFVPETQSIEKLLDTFRANRVHAAIAVDEFGGLAGLVTLSDVVREIFGAGGVLPREGSRILNLRDGSYIMKGGTKLEEVAAAIGGFEFEFQPDDSISSLLISRNGSVPRVGKKIEIGRCLFEIEQATPKTILQVRLRRPNPSTVEKNE